MRNLISAMDSMTSPHESTPQESSDEIDKTCLTRAERELLSLVAEGLNDDEIAALLGTSEQEVTRCVEHLLLQTGVKNRMELALFGLAEG